MKKTLSVLLAAGIAYLPLSAYAQDGAQEPVAATGDVASPEDAGVVAVEEEHAAEAAEEGHAETPHYPLKKPEEVDWSFDGPFGTWDLAQLQRGFQVYREVCSACHSMNFVAFRNLEALGYSEDQISSLAGEYTVQDGPDDTGEMFERPAVGSDYLPAPYPNPQAAAASNNGAVPPDLSLIAKARAVERGFPTFVFDIFTQYAEAGPDYIHALLTGYGEEPPAGVQVMDGTYYNPYFISSAALAMPQPIYEDQVTYSDGAPQTVEQYSRDVTAFLMWAAEPHMTERKATGFVTMIFLIVFAVLLFLVKRRVWASTPH
ncbi:cytochrome c1 [Fulvimarina endophytica]|uniref:Cytochrome c1 n=1 Tax=Fulvimarina endophytica TaxID=2293836 RepID=A0A371WZP9_9HYPH|nr:cytochrome c1 [Fulvimarina endophytica]RFC62461.1 cytochrome c1 [Fulvimarina endophytica]